MASEEGLGLRLAPAAARPPDYRPQNPLHSRSHLGCVGLGYVVLCCVVFCSVLFCCTGPHQDITIDH
ncbi:hypothetical protein M0804_001624 [Polistes exclamans]|nr:hypothetical protein M0804_001624 [Polistes exclamans]